MAWSMSCHIISGRQSLPHLHYYRPQCQLQPLCCSVHQEECAQLLRKLLCPLQVISTLVDLCKELHDRAPAGSPRGLWNDGQPVGDRTLPTVEELQRHLAHAEIVMLNAPGELNL